MREVAQISTAMQLIKYEKFPLSMKDMKECCSFKGIYLNMCPSKFKDIVKYK